EPARSVQQLGFDWISLSERPDSPRILTPSPPLSAAYLASQVDGIKIALLGPIVPVSNPIRVAEELAMLDTMLPGRFVFGLLRGTTNEYLSYDLNPKEARERTHDGMELSLKASTDEQADAALARRSAQSQPPFPIGARLRSALIEQDKRNVGGEQRPANVGGILPISFCGGPDRVIKQIKQAREEIGVGVLDLSLADPGSGDTDAMMSGIELFGKKVLPRIRDI